MAAPLDTVSPAVPNTGLNVGIAPPKFGSVVAGGGGGATDVLWSDGNFETLTNDSTLDVIIPDNVEFLRLIGQTVQASASSNLPNSGQWTKGVCMLVYARQFSGVGPFIPQAVVKTPAGLFIESTAANFDPTS